MAVSNSDRVGKALSVLADGLSPFVEQECRSKYGDDWVNQVAARPPDSQGDIYFLLKVIWDEWHTVFRDVLGEMERTYVKELRDVRNRWAHQEKFSSEDAYRALDTAQRLLQGIAAGDPAAEVERLKQELLRTKFSEDARTARRRATAVPLEGMEIAGLKPWREIATPHPDVASGRYVQAEFAADLAQVHRGEGNDEYRDPEQFYARTYITEGLRQLLVQALQRLTKAGGVPIVDLQTNFGGGKTHSLLALYHLCSGVKPNKLAGLEPILEQAQVKELGSVNRAVLVGTSISPGQVHSKPDGTKVHTLWGELAWQLGGAEAYDYVADSDRTATNPGAALNELFTRYGPCLVLIDEWVAYARQLYGKEGLPAGTFDTHFTFAQALTEAARAVPGTLVVISIPASESASDGRSPGIEIGGEGGRAALDRLRNVIGRMESPWRPASAEESFEIVRRRLFADPANAKAHTDRDAVASEFANLYRTEAAEFPSDCREKDYEKRIQAAYPIHPELFDRLYEDWSTLERFQRTRGVLRLMAAVINVLWERGDPSPVIMPASVPLDDIRVARELRRYLDDNWNPVIDQDVDGTASTPYEIDAENPNLGRYSATRRVARTVFIGSAPKAELAHRGIEDKRIKLGCLLPGEKPPIFGDALRRLRDNATFLYVDKDRYWYSTQASVTKLAQDRADQLERRLDEIDLELVRRLQTEGRTRGDFCGVHVAPTGPEDVPDEPECRLVILGPGQDHSAKTTESVAVDAAKAILDQRKGGPRRFRNMLTFVAADRSRLEELRHSVRQYLAWKSIEEEKEQLNLDAFQSRQATDRRSGADDAVRQRIAETYCWLIAPYQELGGDTTWEAKRVAGQDSVALRASKKLRTDEGLITKLAPLRLRMELDRVPLWRGDHVGVKQLWEDFCQYVYLPRLKDVDVFLGAVADGPAQTTWVQDGFAYAAAWDGSAGRYRGLTASGAASVVLDDQAVLVKPEVALRQLEAETPSTAGARDDAAEAAIGAGAEDGSEAGESSDSRLVGPSRFYGRVRLDPLKMSSQAAEIAEAIVQHLAGMVGSEVTVTLEVEADVAEGSPDNVVRTVTENARTLNFESHGFEGGDTA